MTPPRPPLHPVVIRGHILCALHRAGDPVAWNITRQVLESAPSVLDAAVQLGIARRTLETWMHEDPTLREGLDLPRAGRPGRSAP